MVRLIGLLRDTHSFFFFDPFSSWTAGIRDEDAVPPGGVLHIETATNTSLLPFRGGNGSLRTHNEDCGYKPLVDVRGVLLFSARFCRKRPFPTHPKRWGECRPLIVGVPGYRLMANLPRG